MTPDWYTVQVLYILDTVVGVQLAMINSIFYKAAGSYYTYTYTLHVQLRR